MVKKEETFLLLSLEEEKAKKLAQVISNDTCRRILDELTKGSFTETQISQRLDVPLPTVHYNLRQLVESGLVQADEFHYSEKGREVNHYTLAKKYIIIAPKTTEGLMVKIKHVLPIALLAIVGAGIIQLSSYISQKQVVSEATAQYTLQKGLAAAPELAPIATQASPEIQYTLAIWFLFGALFSLVIYVLFDWIREKWRK